MVGKPRERTPSVTADEFLAQLAESNLRLQALNHSDAMAKDAFMSTVQTICAHAGCHTDALESGGYGALTQPIYLTSTFERPKSGDYNDGKGYVYSRHSNPTRSQLESTLAGLDDGCGGLAFPSGMAAIHSVLMAVLEPNTTLLIPDDLYHGTRTLATGILSKWAVKVVAIDMSDIEEVATAIADSSPRAILVETPSNPKLKITDIEGVVALCKPRGTTVIVDSTWSTPALCRPLTLGADVVVHSLTKYMAGHGDVTAGAAVFAEGKHDLFEDVRTIQREAGIMCDPFQCFLIMRGLRTLTLRMERHCKNAYAVAKYLETHPKVAAVYYPGLEKHAGHETAKRQMPGGFGGMVSFVVEGGATAALKAAARAKVFARATSLGSTESLIEHRRSVEGPLSKTPPGLLRLSVGLEDVNDLIRDLEYLLGD